MKFKKEKKIPRKYTLNSDDRGSTLIPRKSTVVSELVSVWPDI